MLEVVLTHPDRPDEDPLIVSASDDGAISAVYQAQGYEIHPELDVSQVRLENAQRATDRASELVLNPPPVTFHFDSDAVDAAPQGDQGSSPSPSPSSAFQPSPFSTNDTPDQPAPTQEI